MGNETKRAVTYLKKVYKGRNIRSTEYNEGTFEIESGKDHWGKTYWSEVAVISSPNPMNGNRTLLIDVTGDSQRIMLDMTN